jgi:hypothetical protein
LSLKSFTAFLLIIASSFLNSPLWAEDFVFYFKTAPNVDQLRPFLDPASLSVLVTESNGRPVPEGSVDLVLEAPRPSRFFSTDFPMVEGSRLTEFRLPLRRGKAEWKYLFPIRGDYRLTVHLTTSDGKWAAKTFQFKIRENRQKWAFLGVFSLALFAFGMIAGRIFTRQNKRLTNTLIAGFLLIFGCALISDGTAAEPGIGRRRYTANLEIAPATVGQTALVSWRVDDSEKTEKPKALLSLAITHLEKAKVVFAMERIPVEGEYSMKFQFTDGAEYRVTAIAEVGGRRLIRSEELVSVTGVEPPIAAMIPALGFFLIVIALGLGAGRWSRVAAPSRAGE